MYSDDSARVGTSDTFYGYGVVGTESWYAGKVSWYGVKQSLQTMNKDRKSKVLEVRVEPKRYLIRAITCGSCMSMSRAELDTQEPIHNQWMPTQEFKLSAHLDKTDIFGF